MENTTTPAADPVKNGFQKGRLNPKEANLLR